MTDQTTERSADHAQLVELFDELCAAWGSGDARRYAALFTPSSTYVSFDGTIAFGREAMAANHDTLFRGVVAGSTLVGKVESIAFLDETVAVMHATGSVLMPWRNRLPRRRLSRQTIVAVRTEEAWRISALHNGRVRPVTLPQPDALPSRVSHMLARTAQVFGVGWRAHASDGLASTGVTR